jgi:2-oxoisovalerate dehydrogenase E1 component alpha subunit
MAWFGDGGSSTGDVHEGMNFAGVHKLPVVFVCENNQYAISVHWTKQMAVENLSVRAQGYGFPGVTVDGNDVLAVYRAAKEAVDRARRGEGPTFIEAKTYRLVPHTSDDNDRRYRSREEVEEWSKKDPIPRFQAYLEEHGLLDANARDALAKRVAEEVDAATEYAEKAAPPEPESALRHVFAEEEGK